MGRGLCPPQTLGDKYLGSYIREPPPGVQPPPGTGAWHRPRDYVKEHYKPNPTLFDRYATECSTLEMDGYPALPSNPFGTPLEFAAFNSRSLLLGEWRTGRLTSRGRTRGCGSVMSQTTQVGS